MSKQGQYNFKGINSQSWAAMSLFLQFLSKSDFSHIIFEGDKLEDFCLVFNDGKKIICESKDHAKGIDYFDLKGILRKMVKHGQTNSVDEILIVCPSVNSDVMNDIEHIKYLKQHTEDKLIKKHKTVFLPLKYTSFYKNYKRTGFLVHLGTLLNMLLGIVPLRTFSKTYCSHSSIELQVLLEKNSKRTIFFSQNL